MKTQRRIPRGVLIAIPMLILGITALWLIVVMRTGQIQTQHIVVGLASLVVGLVGILWVFFRVLPGLRSGSSAQEVGDSSDAPRSSAAAVGGAPGEVLDGGSADGGSADGGASRSAWPVGQAAPVGRWLLPPVANQPLPPLQRLERDRLLRRLQVLTNSSSAK